jgi:plasmid maintenance system antidote protein VapI
LRTRNPAHPGQFFRSIVIEPLRLPVSSSAKTLGARGETRVARFQAPI